jgi:hypothetical protein
LRADFYITWADIPKTPAEIRTRLDDGQFTLDFHGIKDDQEVDSSWLPSFFSWRTKPADDKGFKEVSKLVHKDKTAVLDQIILGYPEGLKALQEFEVMKYS